MIRNNINNKLKTCEFCNKSINKRFVKFTNIAQDIPIHYFCGIKCKSKWLDIEKILKLDWHPIEQEYIDKIYKIIKKYKKAYKTIKKEVRRLKKRCKNEPK